MPSSAAGSAPSANFEVWLRRARRERDWTQGDLAKRVGTDPGSVSRWERGVAQPNLGQFRRLCLALGCSADDPLGLPARRRAHASA
jgi:transcriptional regulator with XRE-family HTH domain